jgi:hypothetical protein
MTLTQIRIFGRKPKHLDAKILVFLILEQDVATEFFKSLIPEKLRRFIIRELINFDLLTLRLDENCLWRLIFLACYIQAAC